MFAHCRKNSRPSLKRIGLLSLFFLLSALLLPAQTATETLKGTDLENLDLLTPGFQSFLQGLDSEASLANLSLADLTVLRSYISREAQARDFLQEVQYSSFTLGGLGYFKIQEEGLGTLFLSIDILLIGGTLAGAYACLPEALKASNLNWFTASGNEISTAFKAQSFLDFLPSLAVLGGGTLLRGLLLGIESQDALAKAREKIQSGSIGFTAQWDLGFSADSLLYTGLRISY